MPSIGNITIKVTYHQVPYYYCFNLHILILIKKLKNWEVGVGSRVKFHIILNFCLNWWKFPSSTKLRDHTFSLIYLTVMILSVRTSKLAKLWEFNSVSSLLLITKKISYKWSWLKVNKIRKKPKSLWKIIFSPVSLKYKNKWLPARPVIMLYLTLNVIFFNTKDIVERFYQTGQLEPN